MSDVQTLAYSVYGRLQYDCLIDYKEFYSDNNFHNSDPDRFFIHSHGYFGEYLQPDDFESKLEEYSISLDQYDKDAFYDKLIQLIQKHLNLLNTISS